VDLTCVSQYHNEVFAKFTEHAPDRMLHFMELLIGIGAKPTSPDSLTKIVHEAHQFLMCATSSGCTYPNPDALCLVQS